jgi:8-oxo-dGTP pyrophosphatase MutT (NUDIX family)
MRAACCYASEPPRCSTAATGASLRALSSSTRDFLTAGLRETEEETGVRVEIKSLLSAVTNFWSYGNSNLVAVLLAEPVESMPHPTPESEAVAWFDPENLPELCFEADRHIIQRYFAIRLAGVPVDPQYATFGAAETRPEPPPSSVFPA